MAGREILNVLTEIRDQQRRQVENFESAIRAQEQALAIQNRTRKTLQFLIFAPWALVAAMAIYLVVTLSQ